MLTTHITFSVGWIGTVAAFLALSIVGLLGNDQVVRACYISMEVVAWFTLLFCLPPNRLDSGIRNTLGPIQTLVDTCQIGSNTYRHSNPNVAHATHLLFSRRCYGKSHSFR
jgi:hypothetical protein